MSGALRLYVAAVGIAALVSLVATPIVRGLSLRLNFGIRIRFITPDYLAQA